MQPAQQRFAVAGPGDVAAARRHATRLAAEAGADEAAAGTVAIVASELATNIQKHAGTGEVLLRLLDAGAGPEVEVLAIDRGPGVDNVERCLMDGYSTAGTAGNGLGAVRRLSMAFDIYSERERGTVAMARIACGKQSKKIPGGVEIGLVCLPVPPEIECGDAWQVAQEENGLSVIMVDGLGHGSEAAAAAALGLAAFSDHPFEAPAALLGRVHRQMSGSRGGAVALAQLDGGGELQYVGIGNISGFLLHNGESRGLFTHHGIVGGQIGSIRQLGYPCPPGALLVMHSDGLKTRWQLSAYPGLAQRHPAVIAALLYRDFSRLRDDVTVLVASFAA